MMLVYTFMSGLSVSFRAIKFLEKEFGVGFVLVFPSGSKSSLKRDLWQPYFLDVAAFSHIRKL